MYQLTVTRSVDPDTWNQSLITLGGCPFHTYEWSRYSSENRGKTVLYFSLIHASGVISAMAHGQIHNYLTGSFPIFRSLGFGSMPAYKDTDSLNNMIRQIREYAHRKGYLSVQWTSFGTPEACSLCNDLPDDGKKRWEFIVDLDGTAEDLRKRLHGKKRNLIKKAEKSGLRIEQAQSSDQLLNYRDLALKTWKRKTEQGIAFPEPPGKDYFLLMKRYLVDPGIGRMYLAYDGSEAVAGAFFAGFAETAYYVLSAACENGLKKSAPDLLIWTAMSDYQARGYRKFNLGGVSEDEVPKEGVEKSGLYRFKIRFAAKVEPCFNSDIVLRHTKHRIWRLLTAVKAKLLYLLGKK